MKLENYENIHRWLSDHYMHMQSREPRTDTEARKEWRDDQAEMLKVISELKTFMAQPQGQMSGAGMAKESQGSLRTNFGPGYAPKDAP